MRLTSRNNFNSQSGNIQADKFIQQLKKNNNRKSPLKILSPTENESGIGTGRKKNSFVGKIPKASPVGGGQTFKLKKFTSKPPKIIKIGGQSGATDQKLPPADEAAAIAAAQETGDLLGITQV